MNDYYFEGDPNVDSTRRQMERLIEGRPSRRWPWFAAALAGGAAFTWWRMRARRARTGEAESEAPARTPREAHR